MGAAALVPVRGARPSGSIPPVASLTGRSGAIALVTAGGAGARRAISAVAAARPRAGRSVAPVAARAIGSLPSITTGRRRPVPPVAALTSISRSGPGRPAPLGAGARPVASPGGPVPPVAPGVPTGARGPARPIVGSRAARSASGPAIAARPSRRSGSGSVRLAPATSGARSPAAGASHRTRGTRPWVGWPAPWARRIRVLRCGHPPSVPVRERAPAQAGALF